MTDTETIKIISSKALKAVRRKSSIAIFIIWFVSIISGLFIYSNNKSLLKLNEGGLNLITYNKQPSPPVNIANKSEEESYVLVKYNKRLILTRYTSLSRKSDSEINNQLLTENENHPVIIKRQIKKPTIKKTDFSIKSIPQ